MTTINIFQKQNSLLDEAATVIHAVHLLNDFSGSPLVFSEQIKKLIANKSQVILYTATPSGNGFLSQLPGVFCKPIFYKWSPNKFATFLYFLWAQLTIFLKLLYHVKKNEIVYVNTLLPFVALIAAKLKGAKTIIHVHEISLKPAIVKQLSVYVTEHFANEAIFVSNYVRSQYNFKRPNSVVIFNTIPQSFISKASEFLKLNEGTQNNILMLCSMKAYKGIYEFIDIAQMLPQHTFELVLNANSDEVDRWKMQQKIPNNCIIYSSQSNTHKFYERAAIVMNLSRPNEWVETFGMTILEAMAYKCFVIVPEIGGPAELLEKYSNGVCVNGKNYVEIKNIIEKYFRK